MFENVLFPAGAIKGSLRKARRLVNCSRSAKTLKQACNRAHRAAVRRALRTGNPKNLRDLRPGSAWDLS